jgi:hypothetical protein
MSLMETSNGFVPLPPGLTPVPRAAKRIGMSACGLANVLARAGKLINYEGRNYCPVSYLVKVQQARVILGYGHAPKPKAGGK